MEGIKKLEDKIISEGFTTSTLFSKLAKASETTMPTVFVRLPRFKIHSEVDFQKISGHEPDSKNLNMKLVHKAIVEVDEGVPKNSSCKC